MPFREIYFKRYPCSYKGHHNIAYEEIAAIKYILVRKIIASAKLKKVLNQFLKIRIKITKQGLLS